MLIRPAAGKALGAFDPGAAHESFARWFGKRLGAPIRALSRSPRPLELPDDKGISLALQRWCAQVLKGLKVLYTNRLTMPRNAILSILLTVYYLNKARPEVKISVQSQFNGRNSTSAFLMMVRKVEERIVALSRNRIWRNVKAGIDGNHHQLASTMQTQNADLVSFIVSRECTEIRRI